MISVKCPSQQVPANANASPNCDPDCQEDAPSFIKRFLKGLASLLPAPAYRRLRTVYRGVWAEIDLLLITIRDWRAFRCGSGVFSGNRLEVMEASIIKSYHRIEKGLALSNPRPGFGADAIVSLLEEIRYYIVKAGPNRVTRAATNALHEYAMFNSARGNALPKLERTVTDLIAEHENSGVKISAGGTRQVRRDDIYRAARHDMQDFFSTRYSVRCFDPQPVDMPTITAAVLMAQKTPSVCNREAGRVIVIEDKHLQAKLLAYQNGNRGFGDQANKLLVVGSSLDCFLTVEERHQAWIDGGMFAMSLVYALHSLGLGSCCLNWSVKPSVDRAFKKLAGIPENMAIMMLLAVGHLPEVFPVAQSPRRPLSQILGRACSIDGEHSCLSWAEA